MRYKPKIKFYWIDYFIIKNKSTQYKNRLAKKLFLCLYKILSHSITLNQ